MNREEYAKLTVDEKRIKVAELCGWEWKKGEQISECWHKGKHYAGAQLFPRRTNKELESNYLPNYLNDLNAMHEAEEVAFNGQSNDLLELEYMKNLAKIKGISHEDDEEISAYIYTATAAQRAEAFVLTLTND